MNIDNSAWGVQGRYIGKREPVKNCPQPDAPLGYAVQYPLTSICYYGTFNQRRGEVSRDALGVYWCDGKRFPHLQLALDYAEAVHG